MIQIQKQKDGFKETWELDMYWKSRPVFSTSNMELKFWINSRQHKFLQIHKKSECHKQISRLLQPDQRQKQNHNREYLLVQQPPYWCTKEDGLTLSHQNKILPRTIFREKWSIFFDTIKRYRGKTMEQLNFIKLNSKNVHNLLPLLPPGNIAMIWWPSPEQSSWQHQGVGSSQDNPPNCPNVPRPASSPSSQCPTHQESTALTLQFTLPDALCWCGEPFSDNGPFARRDAWRIPESTPAGLSSRGNSSHPRRTEWATTQLEHWELEGSSPTEPHVRHPSFNGTGSPLHTTACGFSIRAAVVSCAALQARPLPIPNLGFALVNADARLPAQFVFQQPHLKHSWWPADDMNIIQEGEELLDQSPMQTQAEEQRHQWIALLPAFSSPHVMHRAFIILPEKCWWWPVEQAHERDQSVNHVWTWHFGRQGRKHRCHQWTELWLPDLRLSWLGQPICERCHLQWCRAPRAWIFLQCCQLAHADYSDNLVRDPGSRQLLTHLPELLRICGTHQNGAKVFCSQTWWSSCCAASGTLEVFKEQILLQNNGRVWLSGQQIWCHGRSGHWRSPQGVLQFARSCQVPRSKRGAFQCTTSSRQLPNLHQCFGAFCPTLLAATLCLRCLIPGSEFPMEQSRFHWRQHRKSCRSTRRQSPQTSTSVVAARSKAKAKPQPRELVGAHESHQNKILPRTIFEENDQLRHNQTVQREEEGAIEFHKFHLRNHSSQMQNWFDDRWKACLAAGGGSKRRYQYCYDNLGTIIYLRALQGHSGRSVIDPALQDNVLIGTGIFPDIYHVGCTFNLHSIVNNGLVLGGQNLSRKHLCFSHPMIQEKKTTKIQLLCTASHTILQNTWKRHQDPVFWVNIDLGIREGSVFHQTRSNTIILQGTLPAHCFMKVERLKNGEKLYEIQHLSLE